MMPQSDRLTKYLPPELILDIFSRVLQPEQRAKWTSYSPPKTTLTPFFLGKICRAWRYLTWASPDLWSNLTLSLHPDHYPTQVALLRQWLHRCGNQPLVITLCGLGGEEDQYWEAHPPREIFRQLASVATRWKHVDIFLPYPCYTDLSLVRNRLSQLQSLIIRPPDGVDVMFNHKLDFFQNAPSLTNLSIFGLYYSGCTMLPWNQLSTLSGQDFCVDDCYTMLRNAPNLVQCRFNSVHQPSDFAYPSRTPIRLPRLQTLELSSIGNMVATAFLYSLEVPVLKSLKLSLGFSFDDRESFSLSSLTSLIGRSGCSTALQRLSVTNIRLIEQELIDCIACTPFLTHLRLHVEYPKTFPGMFISDTFLAALCPPSMREPGVAAILPFDRPLLLKLKALEYSGPVNITGRALQIMLEFRWPPGQQHPPRQHSPRSSFSGDQSNIKDSPTNARPASTVDRLRHVLIESTIPVYLAQEVQASLRALVSKGMDLILTNGYTSWIHDNWLPIHDSVESPQMGSDRDHGHWDPGRLSSTSTSSSLSASTSNQSLTMTALPKILLTRRSEIPGLPPPRKPLMNPPTKPSPL
ncbi:hypothetical protein CC1G_05631 [Coprinopsis cinerea okayama7|uniref:Uncharacterized protein n=1 Tax=Coprinopsis cinerea (strain Okayama-7 / 130 / ATCC MYA-4618 / FGSC 9003) TaxID=240176 RepID=A8P1Q1_COPC7|nr:hypothetical protein CC1G_05631 [Coprinopsis cinerea okayama7\|eukprot:XP_001838150.2 hypothetical protein CC1G_05631 [Coprinopsis cinerea okayama7\